MSDSGQEIKVNNPLLPNFNLQPEVDYGKSKLQVSGGKYQYIRKLQQEGGETKTLSTAHETSLFEIMPQVINLSKSKLMFEMKIAARALISHKVRVDYPPIERLRLTSRSTQEPLIDISNFREYWRMVVVKHMKKLDGPVGVGPTSAVARLSGLCTFANSSATNATPFTLDAVSPYAGKMDHAGALVATGFPIQDGQQILVSSGVNAAVSIYCCLDLGKLVGTLCAGNFNFYDPSVMDLEITWARREQIYFDTDNAATIANETAAQDDVSIIDLQLWLARETDPMVANAVKSRFLAGYSFPFPQVKMYSQGLAAASTSLAPNQKINNGRGARLLRVYTGERTTTEATINLQNWSNNAGAKVVSFHHEVNGVRVEAQDILESTRYDGFFMQRFVNAGSIVSELGVKEYYHTCPSYVLMFSNNNQLLKCHQLDFQHDGRSLAQEVLLTKDMTKAAIAITEFFCAVTQSELNVSATGVFINKAVKPNDVFSKADV